MDVNLNMSGRRSGRRRIGSHVRAYSCSRTCRTITQATSRTVRTVTELARVEAEGTVVNVPQPEDEVEEEERAENKIKDTIPNHLASRRDLVAALGDTPGDRIEHGDEDDQSCATNVTSADTGTCVESGTGTMAEKRAPNMEES